jgi:hypothetical protein
LLDPGIAVSKLRRRLPSSFAKRVSESTKTRGWLRSRDGDIEATDKVLVESTFGCTIDKGGDNSPHNSCSSGTIATTRPLTTLSEAVITLDCGIGQGMAWGGGGETAIEAFFHNTT